jgi:hypothetical protein
MHGLYLLWWVQEKQMSPAVVAAVLAAGDLALVGIELPTGWFADRFGHRASLIVGSLIQVAGMLWCWLGEGVVGLVTASVLVALGDGFRSGADQALLYRTCLALDREEEFQAIEARTEAIALGVLVGLVLAGGALVQVGGFVAGWVAETLLCLVGVGIAVAMAEPPPHPDIRHGALSGHDPGIRYASLASVIAPTALLGGAASALSFLAQTAGDQGVFALTLLVAALTAAEAAGSAVAAHLSAATARLLSIFAGAGAAVAMTAIVVPSTLPLSALALAFLAGVAEPLRATAIQRLIADHARARAASVASACDMVVSTIMLPLAGVWRNRRKR